jgi:hypothetical protein
LSCIAALIRLGRKYDFRNILHSAVERLTFENPSTLDAYDVRMAFDGKNYISTRIVGYPGVLYDMLTVARENNILSALPCAYYRAAHLYKPVRQPASRRLYLLTFQPGKFVCRHHKARRNVVLAGSN